MTAIVVGQAKFYLMGGGKFCVYLKVLGVKRVW